jgi:hypothetical protein
MDKKKIDNIEFRFIAIEIRSKMMKELSQSKPGAAVTFTVKAESKVIPDQGIVIMRINVLIFDGKDSETFAEFTVECMFEILDFDKHIKTNDKGLFVIPPHLESIIKPVSISTVRGIIYSELRGTYLNSSIMPVIFMDTMKPEPLVTPIPAIP